MPNAKQFEMLAMQSLLPGLTFAVEKTIDALNAACSALGLPLYELAQTDGTRRQVPDDDDSGQDSAPTKRRGRPPLQRAEVAEATGIAELVAPKRKHQTDKKWRQRVGDATRARWAICKEAGIKIGPGSPTNDDVERAQKIVARRKAKEQANE